MTPDPSKLEPPERYKDPAVIERWRKEHTEKLADKLLMQPYSATFETVVIHARGETNTWTYRDPLAKTGYRLPVALSVWHWLKNLWTPCPWPHESPPRWPNGQSPAVLAGFDIRLFTKIMAMECNKPANQPRNRDGSIRNDAQATLPSSFWFGTSVNRDMESIALINDSEFKEIDWPMVLKHHELTDEFKDWQGPHKNAVLDVALAVRLIDANGMIGEFKTEEDIR